MTPLRNSFTHKDLVKIAKHFGCFFSRQGRGSHEQRYSPKTDKDFTIPVH
ncbi:MAG: type II toxin-antitoxin system HicA family toxin [Candidatus Peribacteria bacterium]|jgi:predicted RNA binding protein YcfA (HicA-like mRNA interferase family)|nr:type II toxin-antitoxin system HicA family toxin [Candidatus Peribacteria bacterium]